MWEDISTAPKDGTPILGFTDNFITVVKWLQWGNNGYWTLVETGSFASDGEWAPTHWMPLPAPPLL